ncbi:tetratricopeptide repeat protein [Streptomyces puniciscabiei]
MPKGLAQLGRELYWTRTRDQRLGLAPPSSSDRGLLRSGSVSCLLTVLRLAAHQNADEGAGMDLAAALVRAGHLARAVELVRSGAGRSGSDEGLVRLVRTAGEAGDLDGARALTESLTDRSLRDCALVAHIPAVARAGELERAAGLAETVRYPHNWPRAWAGLAKAVADGGDFPAALGYVARAVECADGGAEAGRVLVTAMEIAHAAGDHVLAGTFADRVEDLVRCEGRKGVGQRAFLVAVLAFEARSGDLDRLDAVLRSLARTAAAKAAEAAELAATGPPEYDADSDVLCLTILARPRPPFDARIVPELLEAVAETADLEVALALADRAEELLRSDEDFDSPALREALTLLLARHGQVERAMALADRIVEPDLRAARKAEVVEALAWSGDTDQAEALARAFADRWARSRALMAIVGELARRGETARAEALVPAIPDRWGRDEALIDVVGALARQGEPERAEDLAHTILHGRTRARALAALVEVSEPARARRLAARAVFLGGWAVVLEDLEAIAPGGARAIADEVMTWWEARTPTPQETQRRGRPPGRRP